MTTRHLPDATDGIAPPRRALGRSLVALALLSGSIAFTASMAGTLHEAVERVAAERTRLAQTKDHALWTASIPAEQAVASMDRASAQTTVENLLAYPGVQEVVIEVVRPDGVETLWHGIKPPSVVSPWTGWLIALTNFEERAAVELFGNGGSRRGSIRVTLDRAYVGYQADRILARGTTTSLVTAVTVGGAVYMILLAAAARPLRRLVSYVSDLDPETQPPALRPGGLPGYEEAVLAIQVTVRRLQAALQSRTTDGLRIARSVEGARLVAWEIDLRTGSRWWSPTLRVLLALPEGTALGPDLWERSLHPDDRGNVMDLIDANLRGDMADYRAEYRMIRADGRELWIEARGHVDRTPTGDPTVFAGTLCDITDRKRALAQLVALATRDELTGLPNSTFIADLLARAVVQADAALRHVVVFQIDVDGFSALNERYGTDRGDQVLGILARRMLDALPPTATLARLGADQFLIVLPDVTDHHRVARIVETLQRATREPTQCDNARISVSVSIGIAMLPHDGADGGTLMHAAEVACFRARAAGGDRYHFHSAAIGFEVARRLALEHALSQAHQDGTLFLHYQPLVSGRSRQLSGVEALLRWRHDDQTVPTSEVIALGDETGHIVPIGMWVLREALDQTTTWAKQFGGTQPRVSINLSERQVAEPALVDDILLELERRSLPPAALEIEVHETIMTTRRAGIIEKLARLRSVGVRIVLDGYGSGTSSLLSLATLPLDVLKLDRSIIAEIPGRRSHENIVRAAVALSNEIGLSLIAVGVEREEQRVFLADLGITEMQGYLFGLAYDPEMFARRHLSICRAAPVALTAELAAP